MRLSKRTVRHRQQQRDLKRAKEARRKAKVLKDKQRMDKRKRVNRGLEPSEKAKLTAKRNFDRKARKATAEARKQPQMKEAA